MARPQSDTVEYFTHDTNASARKTIAIIEGQFGIIGYAFWFKLLEWLGGFCQGYYYDARDDVNLEFLARKCGVDFISGTEILNKLASLGAIDLALWEHRIIWSQNFVDRLAKVYQKRGRVLPSKPCFCDGNCKHANSSVVISDTEIGVSGTETPHSIVNNSKVNKSTGTPYNPPTPKIDQLSSSSLENTLDDAPLNVYQLYEQNIGPLTQVVSEELKVALRDVSPDWVADAIKEAARANKRNWRYIEAILENWTKEGRAASVEEKEQAKGMAKFTRGKYGQAGILSAEDLAERKNERVARREMEKAGKGYSANSEERVNGYTK